MSQQFRAKCAVKTRLMLRWYLNLEAGNKRWLRSNRKCRLIISLGLPFTKIRSILIVMVYRLLKMSIVRPGVLFAFGSRRAAILNCLLTVSRVNFGMRHTVIKFWKPVLMFLAPYTSELYLHVCLSCLEFRILFDISSLLFTR